MTVRKRKDTIVAANRVSLAMASIGVESALIGAGALAVHGYSRSTTDLDLAVVTDLPTMWRIKRAIEAEPNTTLDFSLPDADDPLGGVITMRGANQDPVQIINYENPFRSNNHPGFAAVRTATSGLLHGMSLRVVDIPHLVALKLYAGGLRSRVDAIELLQRNPDVDVKVIGALCEGFLLGDEWRLVVAELQR
jgi:hypothetical protein